MTQKTLLLLSNDTLLISTIQRWISADNRHTFHPITHTSALAPHLSQVGPPIILLDTDIASEQWPDIITFIHQESPKAIILLIAAKDPVTTLRRTMMLGVVDYLEKPFTKEEIFHEAINRAWKRITPGSTDPQYAVKPSPVFEEDEIGRTSTTLPVLLRLDTAVPATVLVNHAFELAVSIRHPDSVEKRSPSTGCRRHGSAGSDKRSIGCAWSFGTRAPGQRPATDRTAKAVRMEMFDDPICTIFWVFRISGG